MTDDIQKFNNCTLNISLTLKNVMCVFFREGGGGSVSFLRSPRNVNGQGMVNDGVEAS
jgi:hypothetical protein